MQPFEYFGHWWVPEHKANPLPGRIKFDQDDGLVLHVWGLSQFEEISRRWGIAVDAETAEEMTIDLIHGRLENDAEVTLVGAEGQNSRGYFDLRPIFLIFGRHFNSNEDLRFHHVSVSYSDPEDWLKRSYFRTNDTGKLTNIPVRDHIVEYKNYTFSLSWKQLPGKPRRDLPIGIDFGSPADLEEMIQVIGHLRRFLCFSSGAVVQTTSLIGIDVLDENWQLTKIKPFGGLELFFWENGRVNDSDVSRNTNIFGYHDIEKHLENCIVKWFDLREILEPVITLYLTHTFRPNMYMEMAFLSMAQAVEALHRRLYPVRGENGKKISLNDRITDLFNTLTPELRPIIDSYFPDHSDKESEFIQKIRDTRDYHTHYFLQDIREQRKKEKTIAKYGTHLLGLSERLKILLQMHVLQALEIPPDSILAIMQRSKLSYVRRSQYYF